VQSASGKYCGILGVKFFNFFEVKEAGAVSEGVECRYTNGFWFCRKFKI
jgi:hypothetical protein